MAESFMLTQKKIISQRNRRGFTLVELMLAMAISGIVLLAVFKIYQYQQQYYTAQLEVTEIQQNIRGALDLLARDIRMAGYDDAGSNTAKIVDAKPDLFHFTIDRNEDGDVDDAREHLAYDLYSLSLGRTSSDKKINIAESPAGSGHWEVKKLVVTDPIHQPAAENIEHLEFYYLDKNGVATTDESKVRTVKITIIARADNPDPNFTNSQTYTSASGATWTKNDNYRRRMEIMTVECRNVGL